jgi:hypothetical protein
LFRRPTSVVVLAGRTVWTTTARTRTTTQAATMSQGRRALDRASFAVEKSRFDDERFMARRLSTWLIRSANAHVVVP